VACRRVGAASFYLSIVWDGRGVAEVTDWE